jgi:phage baseplate assembly protein V
MKNLLAETDYTSGRDNRFKSSVVIGRVAEIVCDDKGANIRAVMPDKVDHKDQPLITKPVPVLQISSGKKRSFAMPRLGQNVLLVKLPNGTADYAAVGFFYTKNDPPPVTDPMLDYVQYDDGSTMQFDASAGEWTWRIKGKIDAQSEKEILVKSSGDKVTIEGSSDVLVKSDSGAVTVESSGTLKLQSDSNTVQIVGNITHTGNMTTSGVHIDSLGHHTSVERQAALEDRVRALEARVAALEARHG